MVDLISRLSIYVQNISRVISFCWTVDRDECADPGTCSQGCDNSQGSYTCKCDSGYELTGDGKTCNSKYEIHK